VASGKQNSRQGEVIDEVSGVISGDADYSTTGVARGGTPTGETVSISAHEEELQATKATAQVGEVSVSKDVVEEQVQLDVPVMKEEVEVTRRAVDSTASASPDAFQGGTISVPVREEVVSVSKQPRVVEEIEVSKAAHQETRQVSGTVRREEIQVDEGSTPDSR
jgi:uncharacterized protein (TIGR02271 family)